jgi:hypothetical protein
MRATFPVHFILDLIILIIFDEEYMLWGSSLCIFSTLLLFHPSSGILLLPHRNCVQHFHCLMCIYYVRHIRLIPVLRGPMIGLFENKARRQSFGLEKWYGYISGGVKYYTARSFITCTNHIILFWQFNQGRCYLIYIRKWGILAKCCLGNLMGWDHLGETIIDEMILKWIIEKLLIYA